jgi:hypothetical protein
MNRGDVTPHEVWEINCDPRWEPNLASAKRLRVVDGKAYEDSVRQRLVKIGKREVGDFKVLRHRKKTIRAEQELVKIATNALKKKGETLLLQNSRQYTPLGEGQLTLVHDLLSKLRLHLDSELFGWKEEIIVSMSLVTDGRLVCWQLVWPEKKYKL